jgi:hypothetical protein
MFLELFLPGHGDGDRVTQANIGKASLYRNKISAVTEPKQLEIKR